MGTMVLKNMPLWLGSYDFANYAHAVAIDHGADPVESTVLTDDTHKFKGGLRSIGVALESYWDDTPDAEVFGNVGSVDVPLSIATSELGVEGDPAYIVLPNQADYSWGGAVGDMLSVNLAGQGAAPLVRGTIELNGLKSSSSNSTGRQLGAVSAAQKVYASLHVTAVAGTNPTLDAIVQSDDGAGFGSPIARLTFSQKTGISSQHMSLVGAITDDYWRVNYTIGGTDSPSFTFVVVIGII